MLNRRCLYFDYLSFQFLISTCMHRTTPINQDLNDFHTSCDLVLFRLYIKIEIIPGFPDVPSEVVTELQRRKLIDERGSRYFITKKGKAIVESGGYRKYLDSLEADSFPVGMTNQKKFPLDFPVVAAVVIGFLMIICILSWTYFIILSRS